MKNEPSWTSVVIYLIFSVSIFVLLGALYYYREKVILFKSSSPSYSLSCTQYNCYRLNEVTGEVKEVQ